MRLIFISLLFLFSTNLFSFYLMSASTPRYTTNPIVVNVLNNSCDNIGMSADEVRDFAQESLDKFWNRASGTQIQFDVSGLIEGENNLSINGLIALVPLDEIIIGCSTNSASFSSDATLASGGIQSNDDGIPQGVVMLNDTVTTMFNSMNKEQQLAVFAHEFGHAIGIGHSDVEYALMYYAVSETMKRKSLSEDDADAISYLYPHDGELLGLAGSCGTISDINDDGPGNGNFNFITSFLFGLMVLLAMKVFVKKSVHII